MPLLKYFRSHARRFSSYSLVGLGVFVLSNVLLFLFVSILHMNVTIAYVLQAIIAVSTNFYFNWRFTWRDKMVESTGARLFARTALKFAGSRVITITINSFAYTFLVHVLHIQYVLANVLLVAIFMVINYFVNHYWSFAAPKSNSNPVPVPSLFPETKEKPVSEFTSEYPSVGIVVPVKRSQKSIRACVDSLLLQNYDGETKIVLVGDPGDSTWSVLQDYIQSGAITIIEAKITSVRRDANAKRTIGLDSLDGMDLLVLTDSDMILPEHWVTSAVALIKDAGYRAVAGPMQSINSGFWSRYIDENPILAKTPRMAEPYEVRADNYGTTARPPITASAMFTQEAYRLTGGLNKDFVYCYEDYEFFDRMTRHGVTILCTPILVGIHAHRENLKALLRDYWYTGHGAADLVHINGESKLAHKRRKEVMSLTLGFLIVVPFIVIASIVFGVVPYVALALIMFAAVLSVYCWAKVQHIHGFVFPTLTFAFGIMSYLGFIRRTRMIRREGVPETIVESWGTMYTPAS